MTDGHAESKQADSHAGAPGASHASAPAQAKAPGLPGILQHRALLLAAVIVGFLVLLNLSTILSNLFSLAGLVPQITPGDWIWLALVAVFLVAVWKLNFLMRLEGWEKAAIFTLGRFTRTAGPGWIFVIPFLEKYTKVDLRTQLIDLPRQDVITKRFIRISVDSVLYLRVLPDAESVRKSVVHIDDYKKAFTQLAISEIRDECGSLEVGEITSGIDALNAKIKEDVSKLSGDWGVHVVSVQITDVTIPPEILEAMHAERIAEYEKHGKIQEAQGLAAEIEEVKSATKGLSPEALNYYYLKSLEEMAKGQSTKFVFPLEFSKLAGNLSEGISTEAVLPKALEQMASGALGKLLKKSKA